MKRWQQRRLQAMARQMVLLEELAVRARRQGHDDRAAALWQRREAVQWTRSIVMRQIWAEERDRVLVSA